MSLPSKEDLIWADELIEQLIRLAEDRTKTVSTMIEFNTHRYTLVHILAQGRIPF